MKILHSNVPNLTCCAKSPVRTFATGLTMTAIATIMLISQSLARAQNGSGFYRPLSLVPADVTASEGGGAGDEKKDQAVNPASN